MKHWQEDEPKDYKKKSKRASNRPGEGMRILNRSVLEDADYYLDLDDSLDTEDEQSYNTNSNQRSNEN